MSKVETIDDCIKRFTERQAHVQRNATVSNTACNSVQHAGMDNIGVTTTGDGYTWIPGTVTYPAGNQQTNTLPSYWTTDTTFDLGEKVSVKELLDLFEKTDKAGRELIKKLIAEQKLSVNNVPKEVQRKLEIAGIHKRDLAKKVLPYLVDEDQQIADFARRRCEMAKGLDHLLEQKPKEQ